MAQPVALDPLRGLQPVVTLDVYSGRKNPSWRLSEAQAKTLLDRLQALPETASAGASAGELGYNGFDVAYSTQPTEVHVQAFRGVVTIASDKREVKLRDEGHALEAWLAETAGPAISDNLHAYLKTEIAKR
jgi:hypothetical protein